MKEVWKDIKDFDEYYRVSNLGNIYSKRRNIILKLTTRKEGKGYQQITLCKDKKRNPRYIHRLVIIAFIDNPENKPFVNHINGVKNDNRSENLEWVTQSENHIHAYKLGLQKNGQDHCCSTISEKQAIEIINRLNIYQRNCDISKEMNVTISVLESIKYGTAWKHLNHLKTYKKIKPFMLTKEQATEIIQRVNKGERDCDISREMNIGTGAIQKIKHNKTWKHLDRSKK